MSFRNIRRATERTDHTATVNRENMFVLSVAGTCQFLLVIIASLHCLLKESLRLLINGLQTFYLCLVLRFLIAKGCRVSRWMFGISKICTFACTAVW